jgi:hypothetical protein
MRWAGYVARMWEKRKVNILLVGNHKGRRLLGRPKVEGKIILICILKK